MLLSLLALLGARFQRSIAGDPGDATVALWS
jgi:hypothetical protein